MVGADSLSVGGQVGVVLPARDIGNAHASRVYLHKRYRTLTGCCRGELGLERFHPAAVVDDHVWLDASRGRKRLDGGIRGWDPASVQPDIRGASRRKMMLSLRRG